MMSFGFSASDIITLVKLAKTTYRGWKNACGEYTDITSSLDGLCILLGRMRDEANKTGSVLVRSRTDREELKDVLRGCRKTVEELNAVVTKFRSLSSSRSKNWDRLRLGTKNLDELRLKLTQHTTTITAYLETVGLSSLARIEDRLTAIPNQIQQNIDALAAEIRAGRRECSVMTTYEDDEKEVWRQFRRELVTIDGIKSRDIHRYKPLIRQYLKWLAEEGMLNEVLPGGSENDTKGDVLSKLLEGEKDARYDNSRVESRFHVSDSSSFSQSDSTPTRLRQYRYENNELVYRISGSGRVPYRDFHERLDITDVQWDGIVSFLHLTQERLMSQPGPRGYVFGWTLPLWPTVAEHHQVLRRFDYAKRVYLSHIHSIPSSNKFLSHRKNGGREAFLNRQVPWLSRDEPKDRTDLAVVLPPGWSCRINGMNEVEFLDRANARYRGFHDPITLRSLPWMHDEREPLPKGWKTVHTEPGSIYWMHKASGWTTSWHPDRDPACEPGPQSRFNLLRISCESSGSCCDLEQLSHGELRKRSIQGIPFSSWAPPTTMTRWALFPELYRPSWLGEVERVVMRIQWTSRLECVNPGMREHLVEWQERMDNVARLDPRTRHLVSSQIGPEDSVVSRGWSNASSVPT